MSKKNSSVVDSVVDSVSVSVPAYSTFLADCRDYIVATNSVACKDAKYLDTLQGMEKVNGLIAVTMGEDGTEEEKILFRKLAKKAQGVLPAMYENKLRKVVAVAQAPSAADEKRIAAKRAAIREALLNMEFPLRITISERLFIAGDKPSEKAASKIVNAVNALIAEPLLNGISEGLISVPRMIEEAGAMDIKLLQRACAICTKTLADTLAVTAHRSGKSFLRIKYSSSLRKGFGIHWEVIQYQ